MDSKIGGIPRPAAARPCTHIPRFGLAKSLILQSVKASGLDTSPTEIEAIAKPLSLAQSIRRQSSADVPADQVSEVPACQSKLESQLRQLRQHQQQKQYAHQKDGDTSLAPAQLPSPTLTTPVLDMKSQSSTGGPERGLTRSGLEAAARPVSATGAQHSTTATNTSATSGMASPKSSRTATTSLPRGANSSVPTAMTPSSPQLRIPTQPSTTKSIGRPEKAVSSTTQARTQDLSSSSLVRTPSKPSLASLTSNTTGAALPSPSLRRQPSVTKDKPEGGVPSRRPSLKPETDSKTAQPLPTLSHDQGDDDILQVGDRVWSTDLSKSGVVCYVGPTEFKDGEWVGFELDPPYVGKHDGMVSGTRYFTCAPGRGLFLPRQQVIKHVSNPSSAPNGVTVSPGEHSVSPVSPRSGSPVNSRDSLPRKDSTVNMTLSMAPTPGFTLDGASPFPLRPTPSSFHILANMAATPTAVQVSAQPLGSSPQLSSASTPEKLEVISSSEEDTDSEAESDRGSSSEEEAGHDSETDDNQEDSPAGLRSARLSNQLRSVEAVNAQLAIELEAMRNAKAKSEAEIQALREQLQRLSTESAAVQYTMQQKIRQQHQQLRMYDDTLDKIAESPCFSNPSTPRKSHMEVLNSILPGPAGIPHILVENKEKLNDWLAPPSPTGHGHGQVSHADGRRGSESSANNDELHVSDAEQRLLQTNKELRQQVAFLQEDLRRVRSDLTATTKTNVAEIARADKIEHARQQLQVEVTSKESSIAQLTEQVSDLTAALAAAQQQVLGAQSQVTELQGQLADALAQVDRGQHRQQDLQDHVSILEHTIQGLQSALDACSAAHNESQEQSACASASADTLPSATTLLESCRSIQTLLSQSADSDVDQQLAHLLAALDLRLLKCEAQLFRTEAAASSM